MKGKSEFADYLNNAPLNGNQRGALGMLYTQAYKRAEAHFATDDLSSDDWRHEQCRRMVGVTIKEAKQKHFKMLRLYGEDLSGQSGKALEIALQLPQDEAERIKGLTVQAMEEGGLNWGYMAKVAKGKCQGKPFDKLTPFEWEQLFYTAKNRGQSLKEHREMRWDGSKRNKKQRAARSAPKQADEISPSDRQESEPVSYWEMISGGRQHGDR